MIKFDNLTLYTINEAAEITHLGYQTIRRNLRDNKLKGQKIASKWYVSEDSLKEFFLTGGVPPVVSSDEDKPKG